MGFCDFPQKSQKLLTCVSLKAFKHSVDSVVSPYRCFNIKKKDKFPCIHFETSAIFTNLPMSLTITKKRYITMDRKLPTVVQPTCRENAIHFRQDSSFGAMRRYPNPSEAPNISNRCSKLGLGSKIMARSEIMAPSSCAVMGTSVPWRVIRKTFS